MNHSLCSRYLLKTGVLSFGYTAQRQFNLLQWRMLDFPYGGGAQSQRCWRQPRPSI